MKLIVCLDNNFGMLFNNRRQSRDRLVIEDITKDKKKILVNEFSKELFENYDNVMVISDIIEHVKGSESKKEIKLDNNNDNNNTEYLFIENILPSKLEDFIDEIIIYLWNRDYPSDFKFDINLEKYKEISRSDFQGNSHEKITKIIYVKGDK